MPSPHELLFGRKPQTTLPSSRSPLKSKHPNDDHHQEANQKRQERQAVFYDRKAGSDKKTLKNREPVFVWNTLNNFFFYLFIDTNIFKKGNKLQK